eukprot:4236454-Heterocapsa_arctica.AAC.1
MDCDTLGYKQLRNEEMAHEKKYMIVNVDLKSDFVNNIMPLNVHSGWMVSQVSGPDGAHPLAGTYEFPD